MACTSESKHSLGLLVQQLYQRHNKQQQMFDISVPNKKKQRENSSKPALKLAGNQQLLAISKLTNVAGYNKERIRITVLYPFLYIQPPRSMKQTRKLWLLHFRWCPFQMTSITECKADCELQCMVILNSLARRCNSSRSQNTISALKAGLLLFLDLGKPLSFSLAYLQDKVKMK